MSVRVTSWVWRYSRERGGARLVMLALADHAHDDGDSAYPSIRKLRDKTLLSERSIRINLRDLESRGAIVRAPDAGPHGVNVWRVVMDEGAITAPRLVTGRGGKRVKRTGAKSGSGQGAKSAEELSSFAPEPSVTGRENRQRTVSSEDVELRDLSRSQIQWENGVGYRHKRLGITWASPEAWSAWVAVEQRRLGKRAS